VVGAITRRGADPSEVARNAYRVRLHLGDLQRLLNAGDRVSRFAVASTDQARTLTAINNAAFGFRAYPSAEIAVRTSKTFRVLRRFHAAIGVITIVASAIFLLCILALKIDERRRDIAALRLMGVSRSSVITMVVFEAALISLVGTGLGAIVGWIGSVVINWHYQGVYQTPLTFSLVTPGILGFATVLSVILGLGAGLVAATRLVRRPPLALLGR
jgi:putative ABC transport system permease protein